MGVNSTDRVTMTNAATASTSHGTLVVTGQRDASVQSTYRAFTNATAEFLGCACVDLSIGWAGSAGSGWDAAYAAGLMSGGLHPSKKGHDLIAKRAIDVLERSS